MQGVTSTKSYIELFVISTILLFLELACIRFFGSTVIFLTFFTNIVLMACFLGMSIGCICAGRKSNLISWTIPLLLASTIVAFSLLCVYLFNEHLLIDVGNQSSAQVVLFGTESRQTDLSHFAINVEIIAGIFYVLIALVFIGPGQVMGRCFNATSRPILAYSANIAGSLFGIVLFGLASFLQTAPSVWFGIVLTPCLYWVKHKRLWQGMWLLLLLSMLSLASLNLPMLKVFWSPYYEIVYLPERRTMLTNNIAHQMMYDVQHTVTQYSLPYLLNAKAGNPTFNDVLIIGAGSGNDVAASLMHGAKRIDAVEIDPVLNTIGHREHPNHPFNDSRVAVHLDDGRNFVRRTNDKYDLVIYALVDSLVLHSGYSNLRLESFLFTRQAFESIKDRLKPGGLMVMYNYFRRGWVAGRIANMAEKVFGTTPLVVSLPYQDQIGPQTSTREHLTCIIVGNGPSPYLENIRNQFDTNKYFWLKTNDTLAHDKACDFKATAPSTAASDSWMRTGPARLLIEGASKVIPTDSWPFLYLKDRLIPDLNIRGMILIATLSAFLLAIFSPERKMKLNGQMFFLGSGFMLLETKGVVHMALLFGSTWLVNSAVFASILVMILLSNLYVLLFKPQRLMPYYVALIAALTLNIFVPMEYFLGLPEIMKVTLGCGVTFAPILFSGIIFATAFGESRVHNIDIGSNIAGAVLGGLSEYLSLLLGFNNILIVAIIFYILSYSTRPHTVLNAA